MFPKFTIILFLLSLGLGFLSVACLQKRCIVLIRNVALRKENLDHSVRSASCRFMLDMVLLLACSSYTNAVQEPNPI